MRIRITRDYFFVKKEICWITKEKVKVPVSKMTTSHLINTINYIRRNRVHRINNKRGVEWISIFQNELQKRA